MGSGSDVAGAENRVKQWQENVEIYKRRLARATTATERNAIKSGLKGAQDMLKREKERLKEAKERARKKK